MIKNETIHMMIDLETLAKVPRAVIKQIGWAKFSIGHDIISSGLIDVDINSCLRSGLVVDGSTIEWWMGQDDDAREQMTHSGLPLRSALFDFFNVYKSGAAPERVWARGPDFDIAILNNAFAAEGLSPPWRYDVARDVRTLLDLYPVDRTEATIKHNAEADAVAQATDVLNALRKMQQVQSRR